MSRCLVNDLIVTGADDQLKLLCPCATKCITFNIVVQTPKGAVYDAVLQQAYFSKISYFSKIAYFSKVCYFLKKTYFSKIAVPSAKE
jgi:hypothetical protein